MRKYALLLLSCCHIGLFSKWFEPRSMKYVNFRSGCRNVSHQQQFFSELPSPRRSRNTKYWFIVWKETLFSVFGTAVKNRFSCLIYYLQHCFMAIKLRKFAIELSKLKMDIAYNSQSFHVDFMSFKICAWYGTDDH